MMGPQREPASSARLRAQVRQLAKQREEVKGRKDGTAVCVYCKQLWLLSDGICRHCFNGTRKL